MTTSSDDIYREGDWVRMPAYRWKEVEHDLGRARHRIQQLEAEISVRDEGMHEQVLAQKIKIAKLIAVVRELAPYPLDRLAPHIQEALGNG